MSAADKREELEAVIWQQHAAHSHRTPVECRRCAAAVDATLAAADAYASAVADERIAGRVHDRTIGRERLAELGAAVRSTS